MTTSETKRPHRKEPMSYPEFQKLVITSAEQYLEYLNSKPFHGMKIISVQNISKTEIPSDYVLTVYEKVLNPDSCEIWVDGLPQKEIEISKVMKGKNHIRIRDGSGIIGDPTSFNPGRIKLVSDMRFLIKRLRDFYAVNTLSFHPPTPEHDTNSLPELPDDLLAGLSAEQLSAVHGIFASPISFVSGAPGTGKTNMVLSRCVLRYILAKKRVFLLAPTNNSVEQMLRGILPTLQQFGIDLQCVYRLGTSSEEFANQYPQVVGDTSTEALIESLTQQNNKLRSELVLANRLNADCERRKTRLENCENIRKLVNPLLLNLRSIRNSLSDARQDMQNAEQNHSSCKSEYEQIKQQIESITAERNARQRIIRENTSLIDKFYYRIFQTEKRRLLIEENRRLQAELTQHKVNYEIMLHQQDLSIQKLRRASERCKQCKSKVNALESAHMDQIRSILFVSDSDKQLNEIIQSVISESTLSATPLDQYLTSLREEYENTLLEAHAHSITEITAQLTDVKQRLEEIGATAKQMQRKNALVLAGTIDSSLKSLVPYQSDEPNLPTSHVFLDEAGYTSLARGMAVFACRTPVTFLGDHRQLPPVCEMNRIDSDRSPVCLWSLSVAYSSDLMNMPFPALYTYCYCMEEDPSFEGIDLFSLSISYRFGPQLADILSEHIYSGNLHGAGEASFKINVIHADFSPGPGSWSSYTEAQNIAKYLALYSPDDFAILTPYNAQVKLLRDILPYSCRNSVLTIHRSQGREWDTVILSVVDTNNPFLMDSSKSIGRRIINTALSRSKRRLIIVCDTKAWSQLPKQLICYLIKSGEFIPL